MLPGTLGLHAFHILFYLFGSIAVYLIPILAGYHRHTVDGKIFVQLVKGCGSPAASAADDAGTGLALEQGRSCRKMLYPGRK